MATAQSNTDSACVEVAGDAPSEAGAATRAPTQNRGGIDGSASADRALARAAAMIDETGLLVLVAVEPARSPWRVAQEAPTDVVRHAGASRAVLELSHRDMSTLLMVRDDGRGVASVSLPSSNGIRGMRERAMLIGAKLSIDSHHEGGTELRLTIPTGPGPS